MRDLTRRGFLQTTAAAALATSLNLRAADATRVLPEPTAARLPRWRGFNLLEKFIARNSNRPFLESDFEWIASWGFDFVRLPMSYHCWSSPKNWRQLDEKVLKEVDQAVEFGRQYGVHVCLNFHRAPGYSVDTSLNEPFNLWKDAEALEACAYHWAHFAKRYQGIPSSRVSFDLVNEPATLTTKPHAYLGDADYIRVCRELVRAIRAEDPNRLVIADGLLWGALPVPGLAELGIAQSTRGYAPHDLTHWKAGWVNGSDKWPEPTWPLQGGSPDWPYAESLASTFKDNPIFTETRRTLDRSGKQWDKARFRELQIKPWQKLQSLGVGVHVGEFGVHNKTPHAVTLAYLRDLLDLWQEAGWGWAMWNLRGDFGIVDSHRADVAYEDFHGHKLDRGMLELLRER